MSSFMVSDNTLTAITRFLLEDRHKRPEATSPTEEGACHLWRELRDMNEAALDARYPDREPGIFEISAAPERVGYFPMSGAYAVKVLSCYLYQCCEGDIPERPLYQEIDRLRLRVALDVVAKLPAYENAPWDIPDSWSQPTLLVGASHV